MQSLWLTRVLAGWCCLAALAGLAAEEPEPPPAPRAEAAILDRAGAALEALLARPYDPQCRQGLLEVGRELPESSLREAVLFTAAVAMAAAADQPGLGALRARLAQAYPASRYGERLAEVGQALRPGCGPGCGPDCPACHGSGTPGPHPALKSMAEECRYLIRTRARALLADTGDADARDSGRNLTPPELKPALKSFAEWMVMQQRRLERKVVSRMHATREGSFAVLHLTVTPEFTSQDYDWRLAIAKACVKDWAVKCKDLNASVGFRFYDEAGNVVGEYNTRNWQVWLPRDGEPPRAAGTPPPGDTGTAGQPGPPAAP
jgi:hypothetical protein